MDTHCPRYRRNMNHTHFSASCACTRENISCLECEGGQEGLYEVSADQMCRDSHVCPNMWLRGGEFVPFRCGCCDKGFDTLADVEAEEREVQGKEPGDFISWGKRFSHSHGGRFWNFGPLLPFRWVWNDPLHLFLNLFNVAFDETLDFFLQHEFVSAENKLLIAECDGIAGAINQVLAQANITARFGTAERKSFCGNDLRALMQHATVLTEILALVKPLYQRMEPLSFAAAAAKARKEKVKAEQRLAQEQERAGGDGAAKKKAARVDADEFNKTAGISKQAAARIRKQQAALDAAAHATQTFQEQFEAHVQAMQQAIEGNFNWRAVNMLSALVEFYEFVHSKQWLAAALALDAEAEAGWVEEGGVEAWGNGRGPAVTAAVLKRKSECMERSKLLAADIISTVGVAREQTYLHDLVYGLRRVFDVVLHPLLAGMQGVEHVNKLMKLSLVSQCTAANNNRFSREGVRMQGDVAQAARAKVVRSHIVEMRGVSLPQNMYSQRLMGNLSWGSKENSDRSEKRPHTVFAAASVSGLHALNAGTYSPPTRAVVSPTPMQELLSNPSRKRRMVIRPSPLVPMSHDESNAGC